MGNLESIMLDGKKIYLDTLSLTDLKGLLERINTEEKAIKKEIDNILKRLA